MSAVYNMVEKFKKYKVILIGGSPMIGKTSLAIKIASQLKYCCLSTDDLGEAVRAINTNKDLDPMKGFDYRSYYLKKTAAELIEETFIQHHLMEKSIMKVVKAHYEWGHPAVIEGWNLYPEFLTKYKKPDILSIWLTANKDFFKTRIFNNNLFSSGATAENKWIKNYLERTKWHNSIIKKQAVVFNEKLIVVEEKDTTDDLIFKIEKMYFD